VAGHVTAAYRRYYKNHRQRHLKNLVDIDAIERYRPHVQMAGRVFIGQITGPFKIITKKRRIYCAVER